MNFACRVFNSDDKAYVKKLLCLFIMITFAGIISIFYRQPASWFDEEIHYVRSIQIANGNILTTRDDDPTQYGGFISNTQSKFIDRAFSSKLFDKEIQAVEIDWPQDYSDLNFSEKTEYRVAVTAVTYNPFSYIIYSTVVYLNQFLKFNVWIEFILMRLFGFLTSLILLLLAVRKIPFGKLTLLLIASLPPFFLGMVSISADSLLLGIAPLFIAYSFYFYYLLSSNRNLSSREIVIYLILGLLVTFLKPPTFILIGLMIPLIILGFYNKKLGRKTLWLFTISIFFFAIITLGWQYIVRNVDSSQYFATNTNIQGQLQNILNSPINALKVIIYSIMKYNFFAIQLGYADDETFMEIPFLISMLSGISILLISLTDGINDFRNSNKYVLYKLYRYVLFLGIVGLIFVALYLQFTPVGATEVIGVQPRYFLPFWILILATPIVSLQISKFSSLLLLIVATIPYWLYHFYILLQL